VRIELSTHYFYVQWRVDIFYNVPSRSQHRLLPLNWFSPFSSTLYHTWLGGFFYNTIDVSLNSMHHHILTQITYSGLHFYTSNEVKIKLKRKWSSLLEWVIYRIRLNIKTRIGLWKPFLCAGPRLAEKLLKGAEIGGCRSNGAGVSVHNFLHLSIQFTANWDPAQRNGFHNHILVFYDEHDSVKNS